MEERNHVLKVLREVELTLKKKDYTKIKSLSNQIIHNASINQDPDVISTAVIIYALSKLLEREVYNEYKNWDRFYNQYVHHIKLAISALKKDNVQGFRYEIDMIRRLIQGLSGKLKEYIKDVFRKAQINKASRVYEHGISMEKTAKILGVSIWELAEYAGKTGIGDFNLGVTMPIKQRIKLAEEIFG